MRGDTGWPLRKIGEFLRESRIPGSHGGTARKLTVRLYGKGIAPKSTQTGSENTLYYRRKAGQFVYSKLDFLNGAFGVIPQELDGYETTGDLPAFDFKGQINAPWFLALVSQPSFYKRFKVVSVGSRKANRVPVEELLATKIQMPPLPEQAAIADILDTLGGLILKGEAAFSALEHTKKAVMRDLLTGRAQVKGRAWKPLDHAWAVGRISEDVREIPSDWNLRLLTKLAKLESGHTPDREHPEYWNGEIPWLSLQDTERLDGSTIFQTKETITQEGLDNSSARMMPAGTVVFSRTATVGKCALLGKAMATSQDFANWICGKQIDPHYLLQLMEHLEREWERIQAGSTHKTIYMPDFKRLQILLPPLAEQKRIAAIGSAFDARIRAERAVLEELTAVKAALARELLSGRVRLPTAMIACHESRPRKTAGRGKAA